MIRSILATLALAITLATGGLAAAEERLVLELKSGEVEIAFLRRPDGSLVAPAHVERVSLLARQGAYDGIAFHRVIARFMAQTGDVEHGKVRADGSVSSEAGRGGSSLPDIAAELSDVPFERGIVGAARLGHDYDTANSQFFIMLEPAYHLDGEYTAWGRVTRGMEHVDNIKIGSRALSGRVTEPDSIVAATIVGTE